VEEQFIGEYKVLGKVGAGGMAKVYLGVHKDIPNLKVVLKILGDVRLVERFKQEADKLALLDGNPNICQIKTFFTHGEEFVIAMEYIDGKTVEDLIKEKGKLGLEESVNIIAKVLETLSVAHEKKICHRDIKPSNIMIDNRGQRKIIDFGIAKADDDPDLTTAGAACGTPAYMAPEQFTPSIRTNYALVDIYAVGTTLFHMLTGELPFKGDNQFVLRDAKLFNEPARPRQFNPDIPKKVENIILRALDKNYDERYQTANDMRRELLESAGIESRPAETMVVAPKDESGKSPKKSFPVLPVGIVGVLAVLVAAYFLFFKGGETQLPIAPGLISPLDGISLTEKRPVLSWEKISGDNISYRLEWGADSTFVSAEKITDLAAVQFVPDSDLSPGKYFWRVQGANSEGKSGPYSATRRFIISAPSTDTAAGIPSGDLAIVVRPSGDIYIDDILQGKNRSSLAATLPPGEHSVRVDNPRSVQKTITEKVVVETGLKRDLTFRFEMPMEKPELIELVELRVGSRPLHGAEVYIDGERQTLPTPNTYKVKPGRHIVRAVLLMDGRTLAKIDTIEVAPGEPHKLMFEFTQ